MRFLVSDAPADSNLPLYITVNYHLSRSHRAFRITVIAEWKISIALDWPFGDGEGPPPHITRDWLHLVDSVFGKDEEHQPTESIAIHCVAGLGRAPLLVAIALIEAGLTPEESIARVREKRRGALNTKQAKFIMDYRHKKSLKSKCTIL
ncbi:Protein tyrosine phosphatase type IVA 1 [Linnemannia hyalina]|uniref:Protein tyrosine phosphatase type IVA 1 n=1 Tax=Linnemannia hyalina TaxID=64524 RepID=A0A9P8BYJ8_9FUNG|nr:Protein tyrosine phosphatase type IVA 1 [Linnemannia hyalina]